ncbi:MAG: hypothetical protein N3G22_01925 [Candidatus Micrarchaeota archaeon]|nr:hypothetical protein [Candidatus Micrarchaeota archaeon]
MSLWENIDRLELFLERMKRIYAEIGGKMSKVKRKLGVGCVGCGMCNFNKELER